MTATATLAAFAVLEVTLCAIPGPAVLVTVASTLRRGRAHGFATLGGIVSGNTIYFVLSGIGVVALLLASYRAFTILKLAGAAYLAYLGVRGLFARSEPFEKVDEIALRASARDASARDNLRSFVRGLLVQLSNPKAVVFFVAIVPQFVDVHANVPERIAILALISVAAESLVMSLYVMLADRLRRSAGAARGRMWIERAGGAILIAIAAGIAREPLGSPAP